MGVNLKVLTNPVKIHLNHLTGRTIAVDAYNALYQFLSIIRGENGDYLVDREGRVTSHLSGLFYRNIKLLELNIKPIYILDGKPPLLKTTEIQRRRVIKQKANNLYKEAIVRGDIAQAKKYAQSTTYLKNYMIDDTKRILDLLGIPCIEAKSEGEATAAYLTNIGVATDTVSQDFDALLFGAKRLLRNVTISGKRKIHGKNNYVDISPEEIVLEKTLNNLEVTREQLVDIGILIGTDFNPDGFSQIGPVKALKYVKKYGCLEKIDSIREELRKIDFLAIRKIFLYPEVTKLKNDIVWNQPNREKIIAFLSDEHSFSEDRINRAFDKLENIQVKKSESLEKWF
ncbi:flap endonuclease-1 [Thermoproteota archaeon]